MQPPGSSASRNSRRMASPVRVSLAGVLGGHIDGAWWPRTAAIARELPDLIDAVRPALGEITGIDLNWAAHSPTPVLSTMSPEVAGRAARSAPHHRLMALAGPRASVSLIIVPSMTSPALAMMVLRCAGGRQIAESEKTSKEYQAADLVMRSAQSESARWAAARAAQSPLAPQPD